MQTKRTIEAIKCCIQYPNCEAEGCRERILTEALELIEWQRREIERLREMVQNKEVERSGIK